MIHEILIFWVILVCLFALYLNYKETLPDESEQKEYVTAAVILFLVQILVTLCSFAWQLHVFLQSNKNKPLPA